MDALYLGDKRAADKWGITTRTIRRYRERFDTDPDLSAFVHDLRSHDERNWSADIGRALRVGIDRLVRYLDNIDAPTEQQVREVREIVAMLAEIATVREVLARDDESDHPRGVAEAAFGALPAPASRAN